MSASWPVPIEAVRQSVDMAGALILGDLAANYAMYQGTATVELGPKGFVATLVYTLPGHPNQVRHAHVCLTWAATENRYRPPVAVKPGYGPLLDAVADLNATHPEGLNP